MVRCMWVCEALVGGCRQRSDPDGMIAEEGIGDADGHYGGGGGGDGLVNARSRLSALEVCVCVY